MLQKQFDKKSNKRHKRSLLPFGRRLLFSVLLAGLPGVVFGLILLWTSSHSLYHRIVGSFLFLFFWLALSVSTRGMFTHSIRVLSNVVTSLKEEDFSFRAHRAIQGDALGDLAIDINTLATALQDEHLRAIEAANLLRQVMAEAGAVILAFSPDGRVRLLNRAAMTLLGVREEDILTRTAQELGIDDLFHGPSSETISRSFSNMEKRWIVRRTHFRQHGVQHRLVVLSEASEALRAEERVAWQRLIRVFSHEINNSLAPIKSIAHTLGRISSTEVLPLETKKNLTHGLEVIENRAASLNRFLQSYAQLAKLSPPTRKVVALNAVVARVVGLESRLVVTVDPGPTVNINVDSDQFEHALINLLKNAVDAVRTKGLHQPEPDPVTISWKTIKTDLEFFIRDRGVGLFETENLFVPFYTTKHTGSGIGLVLSRQIIETHGGTLTIRNRKDSSGCEATIRLPMCIVADENGRKDHPLSRN